MDGDEWGSGEDLSDLNNEEGEDWWAKTPDSDGWPDHLMPEGELTRQKLSGLLSEHYRAAGGKFKAPTYDLLHSVTGTEDLAKVSPDDFDKLARALLRDAAKYRHGVKKPVLTAPKK